MDLGTTQHRRLRALLSHEDVNYSFLQYMPTTRDNGLNTLNIQRIVSKLVQSASLSTELLASNQADSCKIGYCRPD